MLKSVKIRLYPNNKQVIYINNLLGSYRFLYNNCLELKMSTYLTDKKNIGLKDLGKHFHQNLLKNPDYIWLKDHNTKVLKQSIIDLLIAYKNFFSLQSNYPVFKSKRDKQSCRFPYEAISKINKYNTFKLTLTSQLKNIKFSCSNNYVVILESSLIKSATLTKSRTNKFFLSILVETDAVKKLPYSDKVIGVDMGIRTFVTTSDNQEFENIKIKTTNQKKLSRLSRKLSRKLKGGKNRDKARVKLSLFYEKLANKKENYLHKVSNQLISENKTIIVENLCVSNMLKNKYLSKPIQELSLFNFKLMLKYKSEWYGRIFLQVDRYYPSSKLCSVCSEINDDLKLGDNNWTCKKCGTKHSRDLNAAINIKNEGLRILNTCPQQEINAFGE